MLRANVYCHTGGNYTLTYACNVLPRCAIFLAMDSSIIYALAIYKCVSKSTEKPLLVFWHWFGFRFTVCSIVTANRELWGRYMYGIWLPLRFTVVIQRGLQDLKRVSYPLCPQCLLREQERSCNKCLWINCTHVRTLYAPLIHVLVQYYFTDSPRFFVTIRHRGCIL